MFQHLHRPDHIAARLFHLRRAWTGADSSNAAWLPCLIVASQPRGLAILRALMLVHRDVLEFGLGKHGL